MPDSRDHRLLLFAGVLHPSQGDDRQGGKVIPPGTHANRDEASDVLCRINKEADTLLLLHEPKFAAMATMAA